MYKADRRCSTAEIHTRFLKLLRWDRSRRRGPDVQLELDGVGCLTRISPDHAAASEIHLSFTGRGCPDLDGGVQIPDPTVGVSHLVQRLGFHVEEVVLKCRVGS